MRVLSLLQGLRASGGIENSLLKEIQPFKEAGIELIVLSATGGKMVADLEGVGANVILPEADLFDILTQDKYAWREFLERNIDYYQPDILYAHQPDVMLASLDLRFSIPLVAAIHSRFFDWMDEENKEKMKESISRVQSFHAVGRAISEELRSLGARDITNIFSPVLATDLSASVNVLPQNPKLVFVGRADKRKGLDILLRALPLLRKDFPNIHLTVIGNDGESEGLLGARPDRELAKNLGVDKMISWLGPRQHKRVLQEMSLSDLLVSSSRQEGIPGVILEAHSLALPVVATSVSAEAMRWGEAGFVIPKEDPFLLAQAITSDLGDPGRLRRAQKNRQWVYRKYSLERLIDNVKSDFQKLLKPR